MKLRGSVLTEALEVAKPPDIPLRENISEYFEAFFIV